MVDFTIDDVRRRPALGVGSKCRKCLVVGEWQTLAENDGYCRECARRVDEKLAAGALDASPNAHVPAHDGLVGRVFDD